MLAIDTGTAAATYAVPQQHIITLRVLLNIDTSTTTYNSNTSTTTATATPTSCSVTTT